MTQISSECQQECEAVVLAERRYGPAPEPAETCTNDALPHSLYCADHDGYESDLDEFLEEWWDWIDDYEEVCDHVRTHVHDDERIREILAEHYGIEAGYGA